MRDVTATDDFSTENLNSRMEEYLMYILQFYVLFMYSEVILPPLIVQFRVAVSGDGMSEILIYV